jgi:hypothetical protein
MRKFSIAVAVVFALAVFALGANQALANGGHYHRGYHHPRFYSGFYGSCYVAPSVAVVPAYRAPACVIPAPVVVWPRCYR